MMRMTSFALVLACAGLATPAFAQQEGLVNVNVSDILIQDIANNLNVNVEAVKNALNDNTIQLPVGVAANVCEIDANVLAQQKQTEAASCDAKTTNNALNQAVKKQLKS